VGASSGSCAAAPDLRPYEGPVLGRRACGNARSHRSTSAPSHHHDASRHIEARHSPRQALAKNASMGSSFISNYSPSARDLPPPGAQDGPSFQARSRSSPQPGSGALRWGSPIVPDGAPSGSRYARARHDGRVVASRISEIRKKIFTYES
jgi:hypothetical protein